MKLEEVREIFLEFFEQHGHTRVKSASLIPENDPTLLFTNAGMVQFKNVFLGEEIRPYKRATSCQRCVRLSGKHNDLENVGFTGRHHTFFEMLGNFSFGDYFKEVAIKLAWEFVTKVLKIKTSRLYVSVFENDDEAEKIWIKTGVQKDRIYRFGEKDNFWAMGDTGPCGPCSEIFYDMGDDIGCGRPTCAVGCDCDRFQEIWNLVFMQFNRDKDGGLTPLPKKSVDTGAGLERLTACLQEVHSNYETDHFQKIISEVSHITQVKYHDSHDTDISLQVVADHLRAIVFLITDGVLPSNEGRGYVLRRIMRRALRHGRKLGMREPFIHRLGSILIDEMKPAYPELADKKEFVKRVIQAEEERFLETLESGMKLFQEEIANLKKLKKKILPGGVLFKLYDTYGFPPDLTRLMAEEEKFSVDEEGFNALMEKQRDMGRKAWKGVTPKKVNSLYNSYLKSDPPQRFLGYEKASTEAKLRHIIKDEEEIKEAKENDTVELIFDQTTFYGESGGQVGDTGEIVSGSSTINITDTFKPLPNLIVSRGKITSGFFKQGSTCDLIIDQERRSAIKLNHTATHLLHWALRKVVGNHVKQAGSLVAPDRLRFDYTHFEPLTYEQLKEIERLINEKIKENSQVKPKEMHYKDALALGAMALFGEKYGEEVRVISVGDFSRELCGGTHVNNTGEIRLFTIVNDGGIASGVRRIEALTGEEALNYLTKSHQAILKIAETVKTHPNEVLPKIQKIIENQKTLDKEITILKAELTSRESEVLLKNVENINGIEVLVHEIATDPAELKNLAEKLTLKLKKGLVLLACKGNENVNLVLSLTKGLEKEYHAGNLIKEIAKEIDGSGGGRANIAQAGGSKQSGIENAFKLLKSILNKQGLKK